MHKKLLLTIPLGLTLIGSWTVLIACSPNLAKTEQSTTTAPININAQETAQGSGMSGHGAMSGHSSMDLLTVRLNEKANEGKKG